MFMQHLRFFQTLVKVHKIWKYSIIKQTTAPLLGLK
jgi:hypothetical protein